MTHDLDALPHGGDVVMETLPDIGFTVSDAEIAQFRTAGFVRLRQVFSPDTIAYFQDLVDRRLHGGANEHEPADHAYLLALIGRRDFQLSLSRLIGQPSFFTFDHALEFVRGATATYPWYSSAMTFGYQRPDDFGCSIWTPLIPIDPAGQRGGIANIPRTLISGRFAYDMERVAVAAFETRDRWGKAITFEQFASARSAVLNNPTLADMFAALEVEDAYDLGDALIFDKHVIHRAVGLEAGPYDRRAAFAMRFVAADSRYDLPFAETLSYAKRRFGRPLAPTAHFDVSDTNGTLVVESERFDARDSRLVWIAPEQGLRSHRSPAKDL